MSDFESFKHLLDLANIPYARVDATQQHLKTKEPNSYYAIEVQNKDFYDLGYSGFYSVWLFDSKGKLLTVGHYE